MSETLLEKAIEFARSTPGMTIDGKRYTQVKERIEIFRKVWGLGYSIETSVVTQPPYKRGDYVLFKAEIRDVDSGKVVAVGHACEVVGATEINTTSFVEAGETSSIGRALAAFGLHGGEYASYDEMQRVPAKKAIVGNNATAEFDSYMGRVPEINTAPKQVIVSNGATHLKKDELEKVREMFERSLKMVSSEKELNGFWANNEDTLNMLQKESEDSREVYGEIKTLFKKTKYELNKGER